MNCTQRKVLDTYDLLGREFVYIQVMNRALNRCKIQTNKQYREWSMVSSVQMIQRQSSEKEIKEWVLTSHAGFGPPRFLLDWGDGEKSKLVDTFDLAFVFFFGDGLMFGECLMITSLDWMCLSSVFSGFSDAKFLAVENYNEPIGRKKRPSEPIEQTSRGRESPRELSFSSRHYSGMNRTPLSTLSP